MQVFLVVISLFQFPAALGEPAPTMNEIKALMKLMKKAPTPPAMTLVGFVEQPVPTPVAVPAPPAYAAPQQPYTSPQQPYAAPQTPYTPPQYSPPQQQSY